MHNVSSTPTVHFNQTPLCSMMLTPTCELEIAQVIQKFSSKKTCDKDGMSLWLLKLCYSYILEPLSKIINQSFQFSVFPSNLKIGKIFPIFKKDDTCSMSNYRPISILPTFSKVYEKVFAKRRTDFW